MGQQFSAGQREREVRIERDKKKKSTTVKAGRTEHPPPRRSLPDYSTRSL